MQDTSLFGKYVAVSLAIPAAIVSSTLTYNWAAHRGECDLDLGYGRGICYVSDRWSLLVTSVGPIFVAVVVNMGLFVATVVAIRSVGQSVRRDTQENRKQLAVYVRMSTLTGMKQCIHKGVSRESFARWGEGGGW